MTNKRYLLVPFLLLILILAACSRAEVATTEEAVPTEAPTQDPRTSEELSIEANLIINKEFHWVSFIEPDFISQSIIPDPENYTLIFHEDGTITYKAACNTGGGSYSTLQQSITIEIDQSEIQECSDGSLENFYIGLLNAIQTYNLYRDELSFAMEDFVGGMGFKNMGSVDSVSTSE